MFGLTYKENYRLEVQWYEKHGLFPSRITRDPQGVKYVIGDFVWHRLRCAGSELINDRMANYIAEQTTGIKA